MSRKIGRNLASRHVRRCRTCLCGHARRETRIRAYLCVHRYGAYCGIWHCSTALLQPALQITPPAAASLASAWVVPTRVRGDPERVHGARAIQERVHGARAWSARLPRSGFPLGPARIGAAPPGILSSAVPSRTAATATSVLSLPVSPAVFGAARRPAGVPASPRSLSERDPSRARRGDGDTTEHAGHPRVLERYRAGPLGSPHRLARSPRGTPRGRAAR